MEIIIAIHEKWVNKILDGSKKFELRKNFPVEISRVWVYETAPKMEINFSFNVKSILRDSPNALWNKIGKFSGCTESEFSKYFSNKTSGAAIEIGEIFRIPTKKFNWAEIYPRQFLPISSIDDI